MILAAGAILGLISVILGAVASHLFDEALQEDGLKVFQTALDYHQLHAVLITVTGFVLISGTCANIAPLLRLSSFSLIMGVLLFSGSIYLNHLLGFSFMAPLAPLGGLALMAGWLFLLIAALRFRS